MKGRPIEPITEDYASDFTVAVQKAQKLVLEDKVAIVIGGYTSASRVSMLPVFEQNDAIFFYGTYYEGLECSPNCFYGGAVPNQFLTDYVPWVMENLGDSFYIVGSDYIYPRTVSAIVQKLVTESGGDDRRRQVLLAGHDRVRPYGRGHPGQGPGRPVLEHGRRLDDRLLQAVPECRAHR